MPSAWEGKGHCQEESPAMLGARERLPPEPVPPAAASDAGGPAAPRTTDRLVPVAAVVPPAKADAVPVTNASVKSSGSAAAGVLVMSWPACARTGGPLCGGAL